MCALNDDQGTVCLQAFGYSLANVSCKTFLQLRPPGQDINNFSKVTETGNFSLVRAIGNGNGSEERQEVMLTDGIKPDLTHGDQAIRLRFDETAPARLRILTEA